MNILVTGVNGFVGHHVAERLHAEGHSVLGVSNQPQLDDDLHGTVDTYLSCDLTDQQAVAELPLDDVDAIINLAGFAKVGEARGQGELYDRVNIGVHTVLYEECLRRGVAPRIIAVSTGAVYNPNQSLPITEDSALIPENQTNEYVISKQRMEAALVSLKTRGLLIIIARPFNHSGPGQLPGFLLPDLGEQIMEAKTSGSPLKVGNIKTKRDYTDVRDVAAAYTLLATCPAEQLQYTTYNICSGTSHAGTEIVDLLRHAFDANDVQVEIDPDRIRPNDVMDIYGSSDRLRQDTGWNPHISIQKMVTDYATWKQSQQ